MAIIDYTGIENEIKTLLLNDSRTSSFGGRNTTIDVEGEFILNENNLLLIIANFFL